MTTPRIGRPPSEEPRNRSLPIRLSDREFAELQAAADRAGRPLSAFVRERALAAAKRAK